MGWTMIYDALYRMTDHREGASEDQPVVRLAPTPGGLLYETEGMSDTKMLEWDDDKPDTFIDDEDHGRLFVTTATGLVMFEKV